MDSEERGGYLGEPAVDQLLYRQHRTLTRRKRNILFPSGVKLCSQETFDQAVANHLSYFHLRGTLAQVLSLVFKSVAGGQEFPFLPLTL